MYLEKIREEVKNSDLTISLDILDTLYSSHRVKKTDMADCFYPPVVLANISAINKPQYSHKIQYIYRDLYNNSPTITKEIMTALAIMAMRNKDISFVAAITSPEAVGYSVCSSTKNNQSIVDTCLLPFSNFSAFEKGRALHEMTHLMMYNLFGNHGNPYISSFDKQLYCDSSKQFVSDVVAMADLNFQYEDIASSEASLVNLRDTLFQNKDILAYTIPERLSDATRVNLLARIFFEQSMDERSQIKFISSLYKAETISRNTSKSAAILLERIGDWVTYNPEELDRELVARFVELYLRSNELENLVFILDPMKRYWNEVVSPAIKELRTGLTLNDCTMEQVRNMFPLGEVETLPSGDFLLQ